MATMNAHATAGSSVGTTESASSSSSSKTPASTTTKKPEIWWSNAIFFVGFHVMSLIGAVYLSPPQSVPWQTWVLCFVSWQLASFGITTGYHRLWSHQAFTATTPLRIVLAWMGCLGFQGSIKWWVLRHRLHHRFTDSLEHDPYSAAKGLWFAHCGWIFRRPRYARMRFIERDDLESDPVVRFQHKHFVVLALGSGIVLPTLIGKFGWGDAMGGYVWGGLVARLLIWHTTFCINSLAHWTGLQPYTEEVTARGNYFLALLTSGEANHNFHHAFPRDFRNGPHPADWDPTKWIIYALHRYTSLVPTVAVTPEAEVLKARAHVLHLQADRLHAKVPAELVPKPVEDLPVWTAEQAIERAKTRLLVFIDGCFVDVSNYVADHPGGPQLLRTYAVKPDSPSKRTPNTTSGADSPIDSGYESGSNPASSSPSSPLLRAALDIPDGDMLEKKRTASATTPLPFKDATRAFFGEINNHSGAAKEKMRCSRVARLAGGPYDRQAE